MSAAGAGRGRFPVDDHDHDHDRTVEESIESNPIWQQDNVVLHSVGIDIGSSSTVVAFSRLHLQRQGVDHSTRYVVVDRKTIFESDVALTPYAGRCDIDPVGLSTILDGAYRNAGIARHEIDTGAVILTGEALRRRNAAQIAAVVSEHAGDLVCATAGHHMEATLAAYGSGAARASYDRGARILNVDIGGGTTKLALLDRGQVVATAAIHVGGRLLVVDESGVLTRLEPAGREHAAACGYDWHVGDRVASADLDRMADHLADLVLDAIVGAEGPVRGVYLTEPLEGAATAEALMFSGGVAEFVYDRDTRDFGDLGRRLGTAVRRGIHEGARPLLEPSAPIRATVLGASEYTVQLSGNTCFLNDPDAALPRRNLPVVRPRYELSEVLEPARIATAIREHLRSFDLLESDAEVAVALSWSGDPEYRQIRGLAEAVLDALRPRNATGRCLYLIVEADIAMSLGRILREDLGAAADLVVLDGVRVQDFDYVDLGRVQLPSNTVPVTIKSLVFDAAELRMEEPIRV